MRDMKNVKTGIFLLLFFIAFIFNSENSFGTAISVDKPIIRFLAKAGGSATETLTIRNKGMEPVAIKIEIGDWVLDQSGDTVLRPPGSTEYSCASWLDVSPQEIIIPPANNRDVNITIRVPDDSIGGHCASISIEAVPALERDQEVTSVFIIAKLAVFVLQETEGKTNKAGKIVSFEIEKPGENKPLLATYGFKNEGNSFIGIKGLINIIDKDGNTRGRAASQAPKGTFPGDIVYDTIEWFGSLSKGEYDVILTLELGKDSLPLVEQKTVKIEKDIL